MAFFRERNRIQTEYSGYQNASEGLRNRLATIVGDRAGNFIGVGNEKHYLYLPTLNHETKLRINKDCIAAILQGTYDEVFEALEIFLACAKGSLYGQTYIRILSEVCVAFRSAGSVYSADENGHVVLQVSEETAANIKNTEQQLGVRSPEALDFFKRALRDLLTRERTPNDIVKDFAIAMEDYLVTLAGKKDYKQALRALQDQGIIAPTQHGVLDKLYAYRGDAHGVAHAGNTEEPDEAAAVWFLETFVAQVKLIEARVKVTNKLGRQQ